MDLIQVAAKMFMDKVGGGNLDISSVVSGLQKLLPTQGGELDIGSLVSQFTSQGGGLATVAASWLGDGGNDSISASTILDVLGSGKVADFASGLGISSEAAAGGLADVIPGLIDKSSQGGSLLEGAGKSLLGSLF